jgi:phospholipase A1
MFLFFQVADANAQSDETLLTAQNKLKAIEEEDHAYLLRHNPFYFAYSNPLSKLQLSFKTKLIKNVPLYFAYTQVMYWALRQNSKPFRDVTFNPDLFYRLMTDDRAWLRSIDIGYDHNSNGKEGLASRSYNSVYFRLNTQFESRRWIIRFASQFSQLHYFDPTNKDIQAYIGPLSLKLSFIQLFDAWFDKTELTAQAVPGGRYAENWEKGGYQFSAAFRLGRMKMIPSFYVQYYSGFAESLLTYNQSISTFRVGVIF